MTSPASTSKSNDPKEPQAYSDGYTEFLGCTIYLDTRPLIPRTETEYWCEKAIKRMCEGADGRGAPQAGSRGLGDFSAEKSAYPKPTVPSTFRVLDIFAGSGCVGVAVLKHTDARVDFGEIEERHQETIRKNIVMNNIDPTRTHILKTDVYSAIVDQYDFILANPPYLAQSRMDRIQPSVLAHEPTEALMADDDGFNLIRRTIQGAPEHLARGGQLWIEHEPEHEARIHAECTRIGLTATTLCDQYGVARYSVILMS